MNQESYLTVKELSAVIKMSPQTIYNKIHNNEFILNIHYLKPSPRKILFIWSAVSEWLEGNDRNTILPNTNLDKVIPLKKPQNQDFKNCRIRI